MKNSENLIEITLKSGENERTYIIESDYNDFRGLCESIDVLYSIFEYEGIDEVIFYDDFGEEVESLMIYSPTDLERYVRGIRFLE